MSLTKHYRIRIVKLHDRIHAPERRQDLPAIAQQQPCVSDDHFALDWIAHDQLPGGGAKKQRGSGSAR
jgi:hypothetical protein